MSRTRMAALLCALGGLGLSVPSSAGAAEQWFLMARHGECMEVGALRRKVPDLGGISDPDAFVSLMRRKGYEVTSRPIAVPQGMAREVNVPQEGLALIFATAQACRGAAVR